MRVTVSSDHRFALTPDGRAWSQTMFPYKFWERYLEVFDEVAIVARGSNLDCVTSQWHEVTGPRVSFLPVAHYHGPKQYLRKLRSIRASIQTAYSPGSAFILRMDSKVGSILSPVLWKNRHPYGVEVIGDPWDVFSPGAFKHPLRPIFRWMSYWNLRKQCSRATAVTYVTQQALQKRYPPSANSYSTFYSDVELSPDAYVTQPRIYPESMRRTRLIAVGTLDALYKGPDTLLQAIHQCITQHAMDIELTWVGDGVCRKPMEELSRQMGLVDRVSFVGKLRQGSAVRDALDQADVFVLPSRQEGLPRAVVEAMARGLPCIGSTVGGFGELLPTDCLIPPNNSHALAAKLKHTLGNPSELNAMSRRNLEKSREYSDDQLRIRRLAFYQHVRQITQAYQAKLGVSIA